MSKIRIVCPECGHRHTVERPQNRAITIGVRAKRITGNQFEYSLSGPAQMVEDTRFLTVTDDLILSAALAIPVGAACGVAASIIAPDYAVEIIGLGASIAPALAWGWLCAEHNQRLKRVLPWFMEQRHKWEQKRAAADEGPQLVIDHRYRDGQTEAGRTIQYFGALPVEVERFSKYAAAILGDDDLPGESLAIANWTGKGKLFSRQEYEALLDLLRKGGAVINQPGKGNILTGGGRRALRQHLKAHPPTPAGERA